MTRSLKLQHVFGISSWDYNICFVGALFTCVEYLAFEYLIIDLNYVNALLISLWLNYNFSCARPDM